MHATYCNTEHMISDIPVHGLFCLSAAETLPSADTRTPQERRAQDIVDSLDLDEVPAVRARTSLKRALQANPVSVGALTMLGELDLREGCHADAVANFDAALRQAPEVGHFQQRKQVSGGYSFIFTHTHTHTHT